jgi:hypothetical protein
MVQISPVVCEELLPDRVAYCIKTLLGVIVIFGDGHAGVLKFAARRPHRGDPSSLLSVTSNNSD